MIYFIELGPLVSPCEDVAPRDRRCPGLSATHSPPHVQHCTQGQRSWCWQGYPASLSGTNHPPSHKTFLHLLPQNSPNLPFPQCFQLSVWSAPSVVTFSLATRKWSWSITWSSTWRVCWSAPSAT